MKRLFTLLLLFCSISPGQTPFLRDSAASYLRTLAVDIGARPMGSPAERRAMEFAVAKFREFGLQEAYILPMSATMSESKKSRVNTNSGTAVGILKGATGNIILIGGHIDSASPEIPGANDDGSGSATVLELARVLAHQQHQSTLVFCLFGGEEQGLRGSEHFVEHFPLIDSVVLMLQIDMANGSEWLLPMYDLHDRSTPRWLVEAAYDEFATLGHSGLYYPTHFYSLNYAFGRGGAGSDHEPFLHKNIPAIDFTSDVNDPIHTPQDDFENFKQSGLQRSGDLVYRLVQRFDKGVPKERSDRYMTFQIGGRPFFIPMSLIGLVILASVVLGVAGLRALRKRRIETDRATRPKMPRLKLFLVALFIQVCVWLSENVVGLIKGDRFPWISDSSGYFVLGFLSALAGIWTALQFTGKLRLSRDPYRYFLGAFIILLLMTIGAAAASLRLMLYPATALLFLGGAALVRHPVLKALLWLASPHFMYRLVFNEVWGLMSHGLTEAPGGIGTSILIHAFLIVFCAIWSFPFLLGFAAIAFDTDSDILWLARFRKRYGIAIVGVGVIASFLFLASQPTFTKEWRQKIRVDQTIDLSKQTGSAHVRSGEYLTGSKIRVLGRDTVISSHALEVSLGSIPVDSTWLTVQRTVTSAPRDSGAAVDILLRLSMKFRPYTLSVRYKGARQTLDSAASAYAYAMNDRALAFSWYSFPDSMLLIPIHFCLAAPDTLTESIEAVFTQQSEPTMVERQQANVVSRTTVRRSSMFIP